jgi:hypothetical protein
MRTESITDFFEDGGMTVRPSTNEKITELNYEEVVSLFERYGVLLFRGFEMETRGISNITDLYTQNYANDASRRGHRFDQKIVHDVDLGNDAHTLHSEGSYTSAAWPEIIWFYCNIAPRKNGETILCDGKKLWKNLSSDTKIYFLAELLCFDLNIPFGKPRKGRGKQIWMSNTPGTKGYINWETGSFEFTQLVSAVNVSRSGRDLCFSNHLLAELGKDPQIKNKFMKTVGGQKIPEQLIEEIKLKSSEITFEHNWQEHDLLMIDNKRFMHGRRAFDKNVKRDIVNIQTAIASFGFGATSRTSIRINQ